MVQEPENDPVTCEPSAAGTTPDSTLLPLRLIIDGDSQVFFVVFILKFYVWAKVVLFQ